MKEGRLRNEVGEESGYRKEQKAIRKEAWPAEKSGQHAQDLKSSRHH